MMDVSFIIVNYNTKNKTLKCIESIIKNTIDIFYEIIVVDNASLDGSIEFITELFPKISIVANRENLGFGKANNIGAKLALGKYLFFLNSDTILINNSSLKFFKNMELNLDIASCGGNLIFENGEKNISYGNFPTLTTYFFYFGFRKIFKKYFDNHLNTGLIVNKSEPFCVDYICGADIFIRKSVFEELNGFDEDFFLYFEETDMYIRMKIKGLKSIVFPDISIIHLSGQSTKVRKQLANDLYYKSKYLYFNKHHNKFKFFLIICLDFSESFKMILLKRDTLLFKSLIQKPWMKNITI